MQSLLVPPRCAFTCRKSFVRYFASTRSVPAAATGSNASMSSNPYPFPKQANPAPHHIFHLPRGATQKDIKARYFELVRIYHPDSAVARHHPPDVAQAHFQAIKRAYDILQGRRALVDGMDAPPPTAGMRAREPPSARARRRPYFDDVKADERWTERVVVGGLLLTVIALFAQTYATKQQALSEAAARKRSARREAEARIGRPEDLVLGHDGISSDGILPSSRTQSSTDDASRLNSP